MRITAEYIHDKWKSINYYDGGYTQIDNICSVEWYAGFKEVDTKTLLLISFIEPEILPSSKSIFVSKGKRADGRWALSLSLMRTEQDGVFELLCADLINYSSSANDENEALMLTYKRYKQWNILLEHQHKSLMDESSRKGLFGEIIFLGEVVASGRPALAAVQGWVGPDGADQDFVYSDCWYEIKTVGTSADSVSISSLEQLDCADLGELIIMRADKCAPEHRGALSLTEAVERVKEMIKDCSDAAVLLENKLMRYGYIDLPEYNEQKYFYSGKQRFAVNQSFPRLTANNVSPRIKSAQYVLSIAGIEDWKLED